jgi:putative restriction endonuclease
MGHAVFTLLPGTSGDRLDLRYRFPQQYSKEAKQALREWIVYYEPTRVVRTRAYFAIAKLEKIVDDPSNPDLAIALMEPGSYLEFPIEVPFLFTGRRPTESGLETPEGNRSGLASRTVRRLTPEDFRRIVALGLSDDNFVLPRMNDTGEADMHAAFKETAIPFLEQHDRGTFTISRVFRKRVFRSHVVNAYGQRCAVTGLRLINGAGRAEVEAAHIRPVEANGPDIVQNGVALSGTAHWMFDRGLISFSDDLDVLVSRHVNDRDSVEALINPTGRMIGPTDPRMRPHPEFLSWHRENCFKL